MSQRNTGGKIAGFTAKKLAQLTDDKNKEESAL